MTPQQLKNAILQLAIQGKLVEQRKEEGTGEELFKEIQEEKQKLIEEGKLKKQKALPEISEDEIPFDIPETWKWVKLIDLVSILGDGIHGTPKYSASGDYYFINGNNLNDGKIELKDTTKRVEKQEWEKYKKNLDLHTILISINGTIGNIAFYNNEKIMLGKSACYFNVVLAELKNYLFLLLKSDYFLKYALHSATGTTIKNVSLKAMSNFIIPLPPLAEQRRIVKKIEKLLPLVDRYEKAWTRLEELNKKFPLDMQKAILQEAIQGKLVEQRKEEGTGEELFKEIQEEKKKLLEEGKLKKQKAIPDITEDEIPFDIPETWKWVRFDELGIYKKGPFGSDLTKDKFVPKGENTIKVYEQKNAIKKDATLGEYYITKDYFLNKLSGFSVEPGDIIVSCAGTIGETFIMPDNIEKGVINQALMRMKLFKSIYVEYFLLYFDYVLKKNAKENSKGSAIKNIPPFAILKNYLVPLPPLAEQKRIVEKIEQLLSLCEKLK